MAAGATHFEAVDEARVGLLRAADAIEATWNEFVRSRAEFSALEGGYGSNDSDPVNSRLREARSRLTRVEVEVAVVGYLNRGKSTLLNALLSAEVSSMAVTPETARPVYVKYGPRSARVAYVSESGEEWVEVPPEEAARFGGFRPEADDERIPSRLEQHLPLDLLKTGVVLKDTPGLDETNPDLVEELQRLTLAELDKATATIFVLCAPPGLSGSEQKVLAELDDRRVDRAFIVCNFFSDYWDNDKDRTSILDHVRTSVRGSIGTAARIFPVNAKRAWTARQEGDHEAYEASGVADLERDLEAYLSDGVFRELNQHAKADLREAVLVIEQRCADRLRLLADPEQLDARREHQRDDVRRAHAALDAICERVRAKGDLLSGETAAILDEPFANLQAAVMTVDDRQSLGLCSARFDVQFESAIAVAGRFCSDRLQTLGQETKVELQDAFRDVPADRLLQIRQDMFNQMHSGPTSLNAVFVDDWAPVGLAVAGGAVAGGMLAGGIGIALIAAGPIGWLAGAALGGLLVGALARGVQRETFSERSRAELLTRIEHRRLQIVADCRAVVTDATGQLEAELNARFEQFAADSIAELKSIEAATDPVAVGRLRQLTESIAQELGAINSQLG